MARIRTIKPEFFTSEDIVSLTPLARLFYVSLWCEADREGRLEWRPTTLKMRYLPGDSCDVLELGKELEKQGVLLFYEADSKRYAHIPGFIKHQVINNREAASTLPAPVSDAKATRASRVKAEGREGREGKTRASTAKTQIPANFEISERVRRWAAENGHQHLDRQLEAFVSYAKRKGATYVDWDEALMTAIRGNWAKVQNGFAGPAAGEFEIR